MVYMYMPMRIFFSPLRALKCYGRLDPLQVGMEIVIMKQAFEEKQIKKGEQ